MSIVLISLVAAVGDVYAASITVDKTADDDTNGSCTLWDAITAANTDTATNGCAAGSGADTITLAVNITLSAEMPWITTEIIIEGADYDIDGNGNHQIFYVDGGNLTVKDITLTGGDAGSFGGAINTTDGSTLTVTNSRLEDNHAGLLGGAIATSNTNVVIKDSVFVGNTSGSLGGALSFFSNDPSDVGWTDDDEIKTLLIDRTTFGEDVPEGCAAADISDDPENEASASGGALDLAGGNATIRRSSFIGNKAGTDGGAIHASLWNFLFENNTVSCNRADADGGGIYVIVGDLILRHSTIYQNSAGDEGGGLYSVDDSEFYPDADTVTWGLYLQNSIIAGSTGGGDCAALDEIDHNIGMYVGDGTCEPACSAQDGPINLGELQGEPAYHPILDGSIAINRADTEVCSLPTATETPSSQALRSQQAQDFTDTNVCEELAPQEDQIGTNRPMYGNCDIGAIESRTGVELETIMDEDPSPTPTATVDTQATLDAQGTDAAATQTAVKQTEDARTENERATNVAGTQTAVKQTEDAQGTDAAGTQTAVKQTEDARTENERATNVAGTQTAVKQTEDAQGTDAAGTQTAVKQTEDARTEDERATDVAGTQTAVKQTEVAQATDAAATRTRAFELTDSAEWTEVALTQTAVRLTQDANATETAIANLPPVEQTGTAQAFATDTAVAAPTETERAKIAATLFAIQTQTKTVELTLTASMSPSPSATPDPNILCRHTVAFGETLFQIASSYDTTVEAFREINQLTSDALFEGQELIVPECYIPGGVSSTLDYTCQQLFDSMVVRTTSQIVDCRPVDINLIDKHPALASGMIAAVELLGYVEEGVEICFRSVGELVFLDSVTDPPSPNPLTSYLNPIGMTCGEVDSVGTIVLVATIVEQDTYLELSSCQVTTTQTLRLRDEVGSAAVLGLVPFNVTLSATARTNNWYNVTFLGTSGWISASYARADGICS